MEMHRKLLFLVSVSSFFASCLIADPLGGFGAKKVNDNIGVARTWTSIDGKKMEAKFLKVDGDEVIVESFDKLSLTPSKVFVPEKLRIPIVNLSIEDRILLERHQIEKGDAQTINFNQHRFWTNQQGKRIEAQIVEASEISVTVRMKDSGTFRLALAQLSDLDNEFVKLFLLSQNKLTEDQILKRLTMYKWRNTPAGSWTFRLEFKTTRTTDGSREVEKIYFSSNRSQSGSWKLKPNGVIESTFGTWQFPIYKQDKLILNGSNEQLYGSTSFD